MHWPHAVQAREQGRGPRTRGGHKRSHSQGRLKAAGDTKGGLPPALCMSCSVWPNKHAWRCVEAGRARGLLMSSVSGEPPPVADHAQRSVGDLAYFLCYIPTCSTQLKSP